MKSTCTPRNFRDVYKIWNNKTANKLWNVKFDVEYQYLFEKDILWIQKMNYFHYIIARALWQIYVDNRDMFFGVITKPCIFGSSFLVLLRMFNNFRYSGRFFELYFPSTCQTMLKVKKFSFDWICTCIWLKKYSSYIKIYICFVLPTDAL